MKLITVEQGHSNVKILSCKVQVSSPTFPRPKHDYFIQKVLI